MSHQSRHILITTALYYANGQLHLGHMLETIQADIWARFQRSRGNQCLFISGDDAHGTPIMLSAQKQGISPETLISAVHGDHLADFEHFYISFDNFYTTHSEENKILSNLIYERLQSKGDIAKRTITQAYDPEKNIFLADRFIKGECPRCGAKDQYGDNCESCGATYNPKDLINPKSSLSGATPIEKKSEHYFFRLENYSDFLQKWVQQDGIQSQVAHKLNEWFELGLKQWDISRDAPYFGFEIPNAPNKYFYVWLDAPIGYMASLKNLASHNPQVDFEKYWQKNSDTELYHFIGKDIVYFHALFWPALLSGANFRLPTGIFVHGFLTINGQKMSKSRGTFITAKQYATYLKPEYLRYYFAAKLTAQVEDIDLNFTDFMARINADLVGKYINLASRCAGFINKMFQGKLATTLANPALYNEFVDAGHKIADHFESRNYNQAIRQIMMLADRANQYIDQHKPWVLAKEADKEALVQAVCTQGLNFFRVLSIYLMPILPETAKKVAAFLNVDSLDWHELTNPLLNHQINVFKPLLTRVTEQDIERLLSTK